MQNSSPLACSINKKKPHVGAWETEIEMMELVYTAVEEISLDADSGFKVRIEIKNIKHSQKEFVQEQIQLAFKEIEKRLFE